MNIKNPVRATRIAWANESCRYSTIMIIMKSGVVGRAPSKMRQSTSKIDEQIKNAVVVTSRSS